MEYDLEEIMTLIIYQMGMNATSESENPFDPETEYLDYDTWNLGFLRYFE